MAKKAEVPSVDDLKDSRYTYYYSRKERLERRKNEGKNAGTGGQSVFQMFFGGKTMVSRYLIFFILFGGLFWFAFYFSDQLTERETKRSFEYPNQCVIRARFFTNQNRYGLNLFFENNGNRIWEIERIWVIFSNENIWTNLTLSVNPTQFESVFIGLPDTVSNLSGMALVMTNTNE